MNLPDFFILGETKCGTTSLYNYLIQHPQIIDTNGNHIKYDKEYNTKEIRYFDRYYYKGLNWYKSCFKETKENEITGEATPMYFYRSITINRIKKVCSNAKFIILLRNPVDRLYSNFNHNFNWVPSFKEKYPNLGIFWDSVYDTDYNLIERGLYYYTLLKWFNHFDRKQFYIVKSEDLFKNTQIVYSDILSFLGVSEFKLREIKIFRKNEYTELDPILRKTIEKFYVYYNYKLSILLGENFKWNYL